ncbi:extracellular solute-binding protein [Propionibacteriaceae bacterium Y2011]|uniref:extracellular solute-binding protein n=1 Tax=Microlunatus sp. Y2014 TaxID=3418488 RepID=UPI003B46028A
MSRRTLLGGIAGIAGVAGLAACGPDTSGGEPGGGGESAGAAGELQLPAYVPFEGATPDLPASADGVPPGFYNYPDPPTVMEGYPQQGIEPFSIMLQGGPPAVPPETNKNYAWMNEQLGTEVETIFGTYDGYKEKFQVTMASGDLPDIVQVIQVAELPRLLEANFTDLTDVLGGDGVKKYPGLANIPTSAWKLATVNGRLWGVCRPQPPTGLVINYRADVIAERGMAESDLAPQSGDEFLALMKELTDTDKGLYAMGADPSAWLLGIAKQMVGSPNGWAVVDGKFVSDIASEEMKAALDYTAQCWAAGVMHPNSISEPGNNGVWYSAGSTALFIRGFGGWDFNIRANPDTTIGSLIPPKMDGGGEAPVHMSAAGYSAFVGLRKTDDAERIDQLLRVFDFYASPFGTEQYLGFNYGVEGYSYEMEGPNPVPVEDAPETPVPHTYVGGNRNSVIYAQGDKESVDLRHAYASTVLPTGIEDASNGLYSETAVSEGATLNKKMQDVQRQVIQGNSPMSAWDDFVAEWQSKVGDAVASELEEAAAAG